ncbi:hypothetical protein [Brachyspira hyodysenteriae]|uniref:hypothetical protein n=1 Tax=Brachyspira hyodysenteriae TaxID=159 RepID=UPI00128B1329|nr:hypothetical protein [Brachyspira hyodysenteriae]
MIKKKSKTYADSFDSSCSSNSDFDIKVNSNVILCAVGVGLISLGTIFIIKSLNENKLEDDF